VSGGHMRRQVEASALLKVAPAVRKRIAVRLARARRRTTSTTKVALTFDDGPHPNYTRAILDLLADTGVHATFFCVGRNALAHPSLVRRMRDEGHAIGSHSMTHPHPSGKSTAWLRSDLLAGRHALEAILERPVDLFRPPFGELTLPQAAFTRRTG
jgi:peptidoglycan/xylan/chitin deacetylase (PgdA/CDA1 family)